MTYQETLTWLFEQLPNYQQQGGQAYKPGLQNIERLLKLTGNPEKGLRFIHIAGTNGKGSVSHMLASVFMASGYRTGLFTSPHLKDFRERIKLDGKPVSEEFVVSFTERYRDQWQLIAPSFFEITTAMAFEAFRQEQCGICIVETGLGGRLDSTNVIDPEVSVITNIGFDHMEFLGDTLEKIAFEKAGIMKPGKSAVISEFDPKTAPVFEQVASDKQVNLIFADSAGDVYETDLRASYQQKNKRAVLAAIEVLRARGFKLPEERVRYGLQHVVESTAFYGRFQQLSAAPGIIVDAAHNEHGVLNLLNELKHLNYAKLFLVYGAASDKDIRSIVRLFPAEAKLLFTRFESKRSATIDDFRKVAGDLNLPARYFEHSAEALSCAKEEAGPEDLILIFGSFYLIQEFLPE